MDTIGGYRLVRLLGFGARAEVYLGHAGTSDSGAPRVAAVKRYRSGVDRRSVDTELEALGRVESPHLLRLRDVATDRSGMPAGILQRLGADNLAQILVRRDELAAGEAVTILAPLAQAVAELHRVGVAHRAVRMSNVLFDEAGTPVLAGFGAASLIGPFPSGEDHSLTAAQLSADDAARADLNDLALLCRRVLDRTRQAGRRSDDLSVFVDGVATDTDLDARAFPGELAARLFELADPLPVTLTASPRSSLARSPASLSAATHPVLRRAEDRAEPAGAAASWTAGWQRSRYRSRQRSRHRRAPDDARHPAWLRALRFRRLPTRAFWVAGAVGVAVLVGALALIPPDAPSNAVDHPVSSASATADAMPSPPAGAVLGDDPVEATRALLQARAGCLSARSVDCLSGVDQDDSAALDNDTRIVASGRSTASAAPQDEDLAVLIAGARLVERLGDSALVSIDLPDSAATSVTVLVIRTGNGWRIRDVLIG